MPEAAPTATKILIAFDASGARAKNKDDAPLSLFSFNKEIQFEQDAPETPSDDKRTGSAWMARGTAANARFAQGLLLAALGLSTN